MNAKRLMVALIAALCATTPLLSRPKPKADIRYAYGSTIDMQGGLAVMPYSVTGDAGKGFGSATGGVFMMRYSYFIGKHFGLSATYMFDSANQLDENFLRTVNIADGGWYKYASPSDKLLDTYNVSMLISAVYRYDFGRWSLRPRLGIGFDCMTFNPVAYYSYDRNNLSAAPRYHEYILHANVSDHMLNNESSSGDEYLFTAMASVQLTYSVADHFFFSAEIGLRTVAASRMSYNHHIYNCESAYNPQNWAEAVYLSDYLDRYNIDKSSERIHSAILPSSVFTFNLGIGWNIGFNRNQTGKYRRNR